jgi:hypothetical protein
MRERKLSIKTVISWQKVEGYVGFIAEVAGGISSKLCKSRAGISRTINTNIH